MLLQKFGGNQLKILVSAIIFPSFSICKIYGDDTFCCCIYQILLLRVQVKPT